MNCPKKESLDLRQRVNQSMIFPIGQAVLARSPICTEILNTTTAGTIYSIFQTCWDTHTFFLFKTATRNLQEQFWKIKISILFKLLL